MLLRLAIAVVVAASSSAVAQVIYEPVTVQHGGRNPYYYAGSDPVVHEAARFPHVPGTSFGRVNGYAFVSPRRAVVERQLRIFTDAFGTTNAAPYGMTVADVVNEANARLPRYFRKSDLSGAGTFDGRTRIVPANAPTATVTIPRGTILIRPSTPGLHGGRLFVFPRGMMDRKVKDVVGSDRQKA